MNKTPAPAQPVPSKGGRLLLGVTGSIATGKSTVARMLEKLGAPVIDFDQLSRVVVEPDKPAWKEIVSFFGERVLNKDRTLNREKLRKIVFQNADKRKKLEGFTHPRIVEEYNKKVQEITGQDPKAVIQAVVPLLIEADMQAMFHYLLMVYATEEVQKKRLIERDHLSEETAMNMIRSQLSPDEKKQYCDFVINNSGSLAETSKQVEELWIKLKELQNQ